MKLIERNTNSESDRIIDVLDKIDGPDAINLALADVYSRGLGIQHYLVNEDGTETRIEIVTDCEITEPYTARAELYA